MNIITLLNAKNVFEQIGQVKISSKLAYKIMKFYKSIETEEEFYNNKRNEIISMYAEKDDNGQPIVENNMVRLVADKVDDANMAMHELNSMDVITPNIKFTLSELEGLELSVADMYALDAFIEE